MKVAELTGAQLDYWVARSLGYQTDMSKIKPGGNWCDIDVRAANVARPDYDADPGDASCAIAMVPSAVREFPACIIGHKIGRGKHPYRSSWFYPSTLWDHGGPIIERDKIWVAYIAGGLWCAAIGIMACLQGLELDGDHYQTGPTPLIAAMRSKVASVYGENVPDEDQP